MREPLAVAHPNISDSKLVLVIDDMADVRETLLAYFKGGGFRVLTADSGSAGIRLAQLRRPDVIILDLLMPDMNGLEVIRKIKADPDLRTIPVIVFSVLASENRNAEAGATDWVDKTWDWNELLKAVQRCLGFGRWQVLIVDDDQNARTMIADYLPKNQFEIHTAGDGQQALEMLRLFRPQLILLDLIMPEMDGVALLKSIRNDSRYADLPVVVVTGKELTAEERRLLGATSSHVLGKLDLRDRLVPAACDALTRPAGY